VYFEDSDNFADVNILQIHCISQANMLHCYRRNMKQMSIKWNKIGRYQLAIFLRTVRRDEKFCHEHTLNSISFASVYMVNERKQETMYLLCVISYGLINPYSASITCLDAPKQNLCRWA